MGNCGSFCNLKIFRAKGDIILDKNNYSRETGKYLETESVQKIIFIQKKMREYLKKKKSSKSTFTKKSSPKSPKHKKPSSQIKRFKSPKNTKKNTAKNLPNIKFITYDEDQKDSLLIPTIKTTIMDNNNKGGNILK